MIIVRCALAVVLSTTPISALAQTEAPPDAKAYIISPKDGDRLRSPFVVRFGLRGMGVTHAGNPTRNMGHHHLLVDVEEPLDPNEPIPTGRRHLHFGAGQTETELDLPPGRHSLRLVLGDADHKLFRPNVSSDLVTLTVIAKGEMIRQTAPPRRKKIRRLRRSALAN